LLLELTFPLCFAFHICTKRNQILGIIQNKFILIKIWRLARPFHLITIIQGTLLADQTRNYFDLNNAIIAGG
jgi:hypothetical protein